MRIFFTATKPRIRTVSKLGQVRRFPAQVSRIIGGLNWMSYSTWPDITAASSLLSRHLQNPTKGHVDAAKHVVRYLKGSQSWGIRHTQPKPDDNQSYDPMNCVKGLAAWPMDVKGVGEMPTLPVVNRLDFYSDSNLGPQDASTPKDGDTCTEDEVKSLLGAMSTYLGGPIEWRSIREDRASRNVCQSEIKAMDEARKILEGNRNFFQDLGSPLVHKPFLLMADNQGGAITKRLRYWNIKEFAIRDAIKAGEVELSKIPGPINGSDIYTKEFKDKQHFLKLHGSIMKTHFDSHKFDSHKLLPRLTPARRHPQGFRGVPQTYRQSRQDSRGAHSHAIQGRDD